MSEEQTLGNLLRERAQRCRQRIGIGITAPTAALVEGLRQATAFCDPVIYGTAVEGFAAVPATAPEEAMFTDLEQGAVAGVVRGQVHAVPFRNRFLRSPEQPSNPVDASVPVMELPGGRPLLIGPPSNMTEGTFEEKRKLVDACIRLCRWLGLPVRIGLLTVCRQEDITAAPPSFGERFAETDRLVAHFSPAFSIRNYGIDFEKAYEDGVTILIEPNGTTGNQVIRTLYFLGVARCYGGPYMNTSRVVLESFKNAGDYPDALLLAAALVNGAVPQVPGDLP